MRLRAVQVLLAMLFASALACAVGVTVADQTKGESGKGKAEGQASEKSRTGDAGRTYFHEHGYTRLDIPPGHYPPSGECRIWYPDRPPGQQPPPGKCSPVPPGAWVIRHPDDLPDHVHVVVYEPERPDTILVVGEFEIGSGAFVRVVLQK